VVVELDACGGAVDLLASRTARPHVVFVEVGLFEAAGRHACQQLGLFLGCDPEFGHGIQSHQTVRMVPRSHDSMWQSGLQWESDSG
jgi:hypothetical protein